MRQVPIQDYETLRPWIAEQDTQGTPALTRKPPVMYALTSAPAPSRSFCGALA